MKDEKRENHKYKLLCLDLDGTLLTTDKKVSSEDKRAVQRIAEKGIQVALVTGRMSSATEPIAEQLGIPCIFACNAGTFIYKDGTCIGSARVPMEAWEAVYQTVSEFQLPLWIYRHKRWLVTGVDPFVEYETNVISRLPEVVEFHQIKEQWTKEQILPNKLLIAAEHDHLLQVEEKLKAQQIPGIRMAYSSPFFLEIFKEGCDKGWALETICKAEGIKPSETIAFGDEQLDIPMLQAAGYSVAMGNAIQKAREVADFVTRSNDENGIAYALAYLEEQGL